MHACACVPCNGLALLVEIEYVCLPDFTGLAADSSHS